jgi:microcystin-dependent protein
MSDQFLGEIRAFPFNFAPLGWAMCNGQIMSLAQNTALFSLLGTTYGGDGRSTFALPNLQGCIPLHPGQGPGLSLYELGETGGTISVTLLQTEIPGHSHTPQASLEAGSVNSPAGAVWAEPHFGRATDQVYATSGGTTPMSASSLGSAGSSQPHNNLSPYLALNFAIALQGIFPPRA